jgi:hypothetical protein
VSIHGRGKDRGMSLYDLSQDEADLLVDDIAPHRCLAGSFLFSLSLSRHKYLGSFWSGHPFFELSEEFIRVVLGSSIDKASRFAPTCLRRWP